MEKIRELLKSAILALYDIETEVDLVEAPKETGADFATNLAMGLVKSLKRNPMEVAEEIRARVLELDEQEKSISEIEIARPGFINIKLSDGFYSQELEKYQKDFLKNISQDEYLNKTVICEFSDPNPFKILHVGHLYTSMVGDAISRIVEFAGGNVIRANFGGDVGLHVAKNMYALLKHKDEISDLMTVSEKTELLSKTYVEGSTAYEEDEEAKKKIIEINKKVYEIAEAGESVIADLEELVENGKSAKENLDELELAKIYYWGRKASYQYFEDFYKRIGVKFDRYYPESTVVAKGLEMVTKGLSDGVYEESDGAVVFKGEKYGLHTRVFINKNGLPTYEAKDIGLIFTKWEDYHFDKSIIITGNDIIDYMKVVLKSVEQYAPELPERTLHLTHGQVKLPGREKMSSRKGNFLKAVDVIDLISGELVKVQEEVSRNKGEGMSSGVDPKILFGAIRYAFLKYKVGGDIIFDVKESVSMTGNSGPYLQYSAVRAQKVLGKILESQVEKVNKKVEQKDWVLEGSEKNLVKKIMQYKKVLDEVVDELSPSKLCTYLYEIAQDFSRFYENVQVVGSEFEVERGAIVLAYLKVLTHGLSILGIEIPEKM